MQIEDIARVVYEANRAYARSLGDLSFNPWDEAEPWQTGTIIDGIKAYQSGTVTTPEQSHISLVQLQVSGRLDLRAGEGPDEENASLPRSVPRAAARAAAQG
jgi:hypothetical protein